MNRAYAYYLALLAEVAAFHRHVLFLDGYLFPWDFRGAHLPLATFVAESIRRGQMPLWEPYTYCGTPIFADIQAAIFYPPVTLATAASNWFGADSLPRLLAIAVCLQIFFAGICTFTLLRRLGAQPGAAFVSATVYQLGCFFAVHAEHMGAMHGATWIPLAWLAVVELRDGRRWRWMGVLAIALAMTILAGNPPLAVAAFGSVVVLLPRPRTILVCFWAVALAAVQLIPTAELTRQSIAKYRAEYLHTGGGIKLGALVTLVWPNYWGAFDMSKFHGGADPTLLYLYCSLLGLALALAAALWKPDHLARTYGLFTLAAAIWMLGDSTPIGRSIFLALPVSIRIAIHPDFTLPVFTLGLAALAGLGAQRFLKPRWQTIAGVIIALDLVLVSSNRPFNTASIAQEAGTTHDSLDGSPALAVQLRALTGSAQPPYRFDMADVPYSWSPMGPILAIPTANGCQPLALERVIQMRLSFSPGERWGSCFQVVNPLSPVLGLANVRYVASKTPIPLPRVGEYGGFTLYENPRVLPRFFFVPQTSLAANLADAALALHAADFDPAEAAIVEGDAAGGAFASGDVQVESYEPTRIALRTHSAGEAFLMASESWYPGWEASIDGHPARLHPTDVAFRGLRVPAGDHRVEMRFAPKILWRSAIVSLVALLAMLATLAYR